MVFKVFRGSPFNHSHENKVFNDLYDLLSEQWKDRDDALYLFGHQFRADLKNHINAGHKFLKNL